MSDDLTTAYMLGAERMREKLHKQADEIERLRGIIKEFEEMLGNQIKTIEGLRLELDMQQATILVPSQKDDRRTIDRLREELVSALEDAALLRAENERLRELIKSYTQDHVRLLNELLRDSAARKALGESDG